jgi:hypothetical protein
MNAYKIVAYWGVIFFLIGVGLFGLGVTYQLSKMDLERNGVVVKGKITDIISNPPYRSPVVSFKKLDGREITFKSELDANVKLFQYEKGQEVDVIYHKSVPPSYSRLYYGKNPNQTYMINGFWEKNTGQLTLWTFGAVLMIAGLFIKKYFTKKAAAHAERMKSLGL